MPDLQQTISLVLEAKDEASQVLQKAGREMAELGRIAGSVQEKLAREGVSVGNLDAIRAATRQRTEIVKQNVEEQIKELRRVEQESISGAQRATQEILQQSRASRDQTIADARQARDEKLAALKDETSLSKAERATREQDIRDEANRTMAQARADHNERVRLQREEQQSLIAEARSRTTEQLPPLRQAVPYVQAGAEGLRAANQAAQDLERQTLKEQEETERNAARVQQQMAKEGAAAKREAILADTEAMREAAREAKAISDSEKQDAKEAADAVKRAAAEKQEAIRADTEAMREAAREAKAVTDAEKQAAAERLEAIRADKEAMREAAREAKAIADSEKQDAKDAAAAVKQAEADKRQALKETEAAFRQAEEVERQAAQRLSEGAEAAAGGLSKMKEVAAGTLSPLTHLIALSEQMLVWNTLYQVWGKVTDALGGLAGGLISTNVQLEQLSMTFAAVYQTTPQVAKGMVDALDVFAEKVPGTREQVREAALAFASAGDSVREILPAASNLAAIMGVDLPRAAQAMIDAQEGRFEMLQITLHTTKQELQAYGLEVEKSGHVVGNTFVPAIERFVAARFGEHLAMSAQEARATGESLSFTTQAVDTFYKTLQGAGAAHLDVVAVQHLAQIQSGVDPNMSDAQRQGMLTRLSSDIAGAVQGHKSAVDDLNKSYGISVSDLDKINKNWRDSIPLATQTVAALAKAHYGGAALDAVQAQQSAIQLQMQTLGGAFSNVQDAFTHLQQVLGAGIFDVLKKHVLDLYSALQSKELERFATMVGQVLGNALDHVVTALGKWYDSMGGLTGILATVAKDASYVWGAVQGLGDAFGDVWTVVSAAIGPVASFFESFEHSKDAASSLRDMVHVAVDLFLALKALTIVQVVAGLYNQMAAAATRAAWAQRDLAASQTAVAASAEAETVAETAATGAVGRAGMRVPAVPGGIGPALPASMVGAETVAGVDTMEAATASIGAMGTAALAVVSPFLLVVAAIAPVLVALDAFRDNLDKTKDEQNRALVKPFIPPQVISAIPTAAQAVSESHVHDALSYYRGGFGAASETTPPPGEESSRDPYTQLMRMLPKNAQRLFANAASGTGTQLIENERNFLEYLQSYPDVLKKLNAVLKAAHRPQMTEAQIGSTIDALNKQDAAVSGVLQQQTDALANASAAVKNRPNEVVGYVDQYWEATRTLVMSQTHDANKAMADANAKVQAWVRKYGGKLPGDVQSALTAAYPTVDLGLPGAPGRNVTQFSQDTWQKALQDQENNLKLDIATGQQHWPQIHQDYLQVLDTIVDGVKNMGMTSEQTWPLIQQAMQGVMEDIPSLMDASAGQVDSFFSGLSSELSKRFKDPRLVTAALNMVWNAYYTEKIADLKQQLQDDLGSGTASLSTLLGDVAAIPAEMVKQNATAVKDHAKKLPYTQAQITAATLQGTHAVYQQQASTAELQLRYDEKIGASWEKIVADINNYATMLHGAGENAQSVELTRREKTEEAAQQFLQTQQGLLNYATEMGEPFSVLLSTIHTVAGDMQRANVPQWQITLDVGKAIKSTTDTVLQGAMDSGQSYDYMVGIINAGATELRSAGWSRVAVENWMTSELRKAGVALQNQMQANTQLFDLRTSQGRAPTMAGPAHTLTVADVLTYAHQQMALENREPTRAGETAIARQIRLQSDNNQLIQHGFSTLIDWQRKQFDFDTSPDGNAANATREEAALIKSSQAEWRAEGFSPAMIKQQTQWLRADLDRQRTGGYTRPPEPAYTAYGGLGRQPGFGGIEVQFGGPSASPFVTLIHALEAQNRQLQNQVAHLKALLAATQATELNTRNTAGFTHQLVDYLGRSISPSQPRNPVSNLRGSGGFKPV